MWSQPFHSSDVYNSQVRAPLIIAGPGVASARIAEPVGLAELAPTVLELAGFVAPGFPAMDGRSVADLVTGARHPDPDAGGAYAATIVDRYVPDQRRRCSPPAAPATGLAFPTSRVPGKVRPVHADRETRAGGHRYAVQEPGCLARPTTSVR